MLFSQFRLWITKKSFAGLLFYWVLLYMALGLLFANIYYYHCNLIPIRNSSSGRSTQNFGDLVYFSFVTQATVGYGDYVPIDSSRLIANIQVFLSLTINTIALGIVFYKFVRPNAPVRFPDCLVYDPIKHTFWFRFWNTNIEDLHNIEVNVSAFEPKKGGPYDTLWNKINVDYKELPLVPSFILSALRTVTNEGRHHVELEEHYPSILISPWNIKEKTTIELNIRGVFPTTGESFFLNKDYKLQDIRCGQFDEVDNNSIKDLSRSKKKRFIKKRLNKVYKTTVNNCRACGFHEKCPFDIAKELRSSSTDGLTS